MMFRRGLNTADGFGIFEDDAAFEILADGLDGVDRTVEGPPAEEECEERVGPASFDAAFVTDWTVRAWAF